MKEAIPQDWWNPETKQTEKWIQNSKTGRWERIDVSPIEPSVEQIPHERWNSETEQMEKWVRNSESGRWERIDDRGDASCDAVKEDAVKEVLATVHEEKGESGWIESHQKDDAGSEVSTAVDQSLVSFLAQIGSQFNASFVSEHTGAQDADELITLTFTRADLDPLVQAGMKPLLVNKLFKAIQQQPGWQQQARSM